jgi:hypothetical protein
MKLRETMIAWNLPIPGQPAPRLWVKVGPHPVGDPDWTDPYFCTDGACWLSGLPGRRDDKGWREISANERLLRLFVLFARMTTEGAPPAEVHNAFLAIDEYREAMPPDARLPRPVPADDAVFEDTLQSLIDSGHIVRLPNGKLLPAEDAE